MTDNRIPGIIQARLIATLSKRLVLDRLRWLRLHSVDPVEADLLTELIRDFESGEYDG